MPVVQVDLLVVDTGHQAGIPFLLVLVLKTDNHQHLLVDQLIKKGCDQVDSGIANKKACRLPLLLITWLLADQLRIPQPAINLAVAIWSCP